jgi:hypothetical protein
VDTLEAHFGSHNWDKYIGHGKMLWSRYKEAIRERNGQREAHNDFSRSLPQECISEWDCICDKWERAPYPKANIVNPFKIKEECKVIIDLEPISYINI